MGWWRIGGETDDVIGDGSADALAGALAQMPASGAQDFLQALAAALRPGFAVAAVKLRLGDGRTVPSQGGDPDAQLQETLAGAVRAIGTAYRDELQRAPRLREILENFEFVLRPDPGRYLRAMAQERISMISAES